MSKYEVGDIAVITRELNGHRFEIGDKVRVRSLNDDGTVYTVEYLDKRDWWAVSEGEMRRLGGKST